MAKPKVTVNAVADQFAGPDERIVEYSDRASGQGGLIAFRVAEDGHLVIDLYQHDAQVEIRVGKAREV